MEEGEYSTEERYGKFGIAGMKNGYNRILHATDGSCELGWWVNDQVSGKYCKYKLNGEEELEEGYYEVGKNGKLECT